MDIYQKLVEPFGLKKGDSIWLSSELMKIVVLCKKQKIDFDSNKLIEAFQDAVGEEGTILIPTFSFDFSNKKYYDIVNTKGITGVLGNVALKRDDFKRTRHPMHSFAVWGKDRDLLASMENKHSFGLDSPFGYCVGHHVKQVILGTDYLRAVTFVHYAETTCNVPYRFAKNFTGVYVTEEGVSETRTYDYAARKLEIEPREIFNQIGKVFEEEGAAREVELDGIEGYIVDLAKSYPIICKDIIENKCANIYEFNIPRDEIFIY